MVDAMTATPCFATRDRRRAILRGRAGVLGLRSAVVAAALACFTGAASADVELDAFALDHVAAGFFELDFAYSATPATARWVVYVSGLGETASSSRFLNVAGPAEQVADLNARLGALAGGGSDASETARPLANDPIPLPLESGATVVSVSAAAQGSDSASASSSAQVGADGSATGEATATACCGDSAVVDTGAAVAAPPAAVAAPPAAGAGDPPVVSTTPAVRAEDGSVTQTTVIELRPVAVTPGAQTRAVKWIQRSDLSKSIGAK